MATTAEPMALNEGMSEGLKLTVSKVIRASRQQVFEAWTKPEVMRQWFGPANMKAVSAENELRVGGSYRLEIEKCEERLSNDAMGPTSIATGVYREIVPNERLSFTWNGNWVPGEETVVTVLLKEVAGGTEVTVQHERFLTTDSARGHEQGWVGSLGKLASFLESR